MASLPFHAIPDAPAAVSGSTVFARLIDGVGFRYRWTTEGLREEDVNFAPAAGSMPMRQMLQHILRLATWIDNSLAGAGDTDLTLPDDLASLRTLTLDRLRSARARALALGDAGLAQVQVRLPKGDEVFPLWNLINGPLTDIAHHVGQIATYRRVNGNPVQKVNMFRGAPPS